MKQFFLLLLKYLSPKLGIHWCFNLFSFLIYCKSSVSVIHLLQTDPKIIRFWQWNVSCLISFILCNHLSLVVVCIYILSAHQHENSNTSLSFSIAENMVAVGTSGKLHAEGILPIIVNVTILFLLSFCVLAGFST